MKKEGKNACHTVSPSLRDALAVGWAWLRQRWNLLWLIPDLVLFGGAIILASAYFPKAVGLAAESGSEEWTRRTIQALATGILSVTLALTWWKGSFWLCRYNWRHRARYRNLRHPQDFGRNAWPSASGGRRLQGNFPGSPGFQ